MGRDDQARGERSKERRRVGVWGSRARRSKGGDGGVAKEGRWRGGRKEDRGEGGNSGRAPALHPRSEGIMSPSARTEAASRRESR